MDTQFIKVGDVYINATEIVRIYKNKPHYYDGGVVDYILHLKDKTMVFVPRSDSVTFERWLSNKSVC